MTARLFYWDSTLLESYSAGTLVAAATSADEARAAIRAAYDAWVAEERSWWLIPGCVGEDDLVAEGRAKLEADLAAEPVATATLYVRGSE